MQAAIFSSRKVELSAKKLLARASSHDIVVDFCFLNGKTKGGHRALGSPRVVSISA
jgi:hypothetical protein